MDLSRAGTTNFRLCSPFSRCPLIARWRCSVRRDRAPPTGLAPPTGDSPPYEEEKPETEELLWFVLKYRDLEVDQTSLRAFKKERLS
jgi:hypothetical protein